MNLLTKFRSHYDIERNKKQNIRIYQTNYFDVS